MKTTGDCLFLLSTLLQDISAELGITKDEYDCKQAIEDFVETQEGDLSQLRSTLLARIAELQNMNQSTTSTQMQQPFEDMLFKALAAGSSGSDVFDAAGINMNHMNLPTNTWIQQSTEMPSNTNVSAPLLMSSTVITRLLQEWSSDINKQLYVRNWIDTLQSTDNGTLPEAFPQGLQIISLVPLLKEGFLRLLVPIILQNKKGRPQVHVFLRRRLREEPKQGGLVGGFLSSTSDQQRSLDMVYDLRIKVINSQPLIKTESVDSSSSVIPPVIHCNTQHQQDQQRLQQQQVGASDNGWFSGLLQTGTDFLTWANQPAADNSYLEDIEHSLNRRRTASGSRIINESGSVPEKSWAEREADRAWSMGTAGGGNSGSSSGNGDLAQNNQPNHIRDRVNSSDSSGGSGAGRVTHAADSTLEQYGITFPDAPIGYAPPPVLSRESSGTISSSSSSSSINNTSHSYVAPVVSISSKNHTKQESPSPQPQTAVKSPLSLVEAKLKAMRKSS